MRPRWLGTTPWRRPLVVALWLAGLTAGVVCYVRLVHVNLTVSPSRIVQCTHPYVAVDVKWSVPRRHSVRLYVYTVGEAPKLWVEDRNKGESRTGDWVADGTTIMLTDRNGEVLARRTVTSIHCQPTSSATP